MLRYSIYLILTLVIAILAVGYLIYTIKIKQNNDIRSIKVRILLSSILLVLFIFKTILASILGQIVINHILGTIIWVLFTINALSDLKEAKENALNAQSADLEIIDLDCKKCRMMKQKEMSRSKNNLSKQHKKKKHVLRKR